MLSRAGVVAVIVACTIAAVTTSIDALRHPQQQESAPFHWKNCGSAGAEITNVSITPTPQYRGKPWVIAFEYVSLIDYNESLNASCTIAVYLDSWIPIPVHVMTISLCDTTNPIAKDDGFGRCPYKKGVPVRIHDNNTVPWFVPLGPYSTRITYHAPSFGNTTLLCIEYNQTYAG